MKFSSTFFPTIACPKGEFIVITRGYKSNSNSILKDKFNLDEQQIDVLLEIADTKNQEMISLYDWTSKINDIYDYNQKKELIKLLWDVAYADGRIDKYEDHTIRKIADLIYVRHEDFMKAKHR